MNKPLSNIIEIFGKCSDKITANFPSTMLYNEGWMLRLVMDWYSKNTTVQGQEFSFLQGSRWYSEAPLPTHFTKSKEFTNNEARTHADGVIGHFEIGTYNKGGLTLKSEATQLVVIEAKMYSGLSKGITKVEEYHQAARNVACMIEAISEKEIPIKQFQKIGFYVIAPEDGKVEPNHVTYESIEEKIFNRIKDDKFIDEMWYKDYAIPVLNTIEIKLLTWEEIIAKISKIDSCYGSELKEFYNNCIYFNRKALKL